METFNAINSGIGGGVPSTFGFRSETPTAETFKSQVETQQQTADDEGVSVSISDAAAEQLKADQAKKATEQTLEKQAQKEALVEPQQEEIAVTPPPPPLPAEETPEPINYSFYESNLEIQQRREAQSAEFNDALQVRLQSFANYTNQYLAQVAYASIQLNDATPVASPNPPMLAERLDLFA